MLSNLDNIIFPDCCDVLEIVPSQQYVYPIYKNGSTSLYESGFRILEHDELKNIPVVEVYVRDPYERFITGVNTFIQHNSHLDKETVIYFATNYLFLNRHFCPQFYWLVNLQRFCNALIKLKPLEQLSEITEAHSNQCTQSMIHEKIQSDKINFYLSIDKVLVDDLINRTVPFKLIVETIKHRYSDVYNEVIKRNINLCNVLV